MALRVKLFEITSANGAVLRQSHPTAEVAKSKLKKGYALVGEVFGADSQQQGGVVDKIDGEPFVAQLLDGRNGAFLDDWLMRRLAVHTQSSAK